MSEAAPTNPIFCASADDAPSLPGAYVLAVELKRPLMVALPGKPATTLSVGRYLYCGSARGPGGLGARLRRHMRRDKSFRWHVDRLTAVGDVIGAWALAGGRRVRASDCVLEPAGADRRLRQHRLRPVPQPPVSLACRDIEVLVSRSA
jgi:hypothetical protein